MKIAVSKTAADGRYNLSSSVLVICNTENPVLCDCFRKNKKQGATDREYSMHWVHIEITYQL
jgi:hypothetical protein